MAVRRKARGKRSRPVQAWTDERRAANGLDKLTLRLPKDVRAMLEWLHERHGDSRADIVAGYIRADYEEQRAIDACRRSP